MGGTIKRSADRAQSPAENKVVDTEPVVNGTPDASGVQGVRAGSNGVGANGVDHRAVDHGAPENRAAEEAAPEKVRDGERCDRGCAPMDVNPSPGLSALSSTRRRPTARAM